METRESVVSQIMADINSSDKLAFRKATVESAILKYKDSDPAVMLGYKSSDSAESYMSQAQYFESKGWSEEYLSNPMFGIVEELEKIKDNIVKEEEKGLDVALPELDSFKSGGSDTTSKVKLDSMASDVVEPVENLDRSDVITNVFSEPETKPNDDIVHVSISEELARNERDFNSELNAKINNTPDLKHVEKISDEIKIDVPEKVEVPKVPVSVKEDKVTVVSRVSCDIPISDPSCSWYTRTANFEFFKSYFKFERNDDRFSLSLPTGEKFYLIADLLVYSPSDRPLFAVGMDGIPVPTGGIIFYPDGQMSLGQDGVLFGAVHGAEVRKENPKEFFMEYVEEHSELFKDGFNSYPDYTSENNAFDLYVHKMFDNFDNCELTSIKERCGQIRDIPYHKRCLLKTNVAEKYYLLPDGSQKSYVASIEQPVMWFYGKPAFDANTDSSNHSCVFYVNMTCAVDRDELPVASGCAGSYELEYFNATILQKGHECLIPKPTVQENIKGAGSIVQSATKNAFNNIGKTSKNLFSKLRDKLSK